jgi:hypothetical protein
VTTEGTTVEESEPFSRTEELLRILVQLTARQAVPEETVRKSVGTSARLLQAYNLSDGTRSQSEIGKGGQTGLWQLQPHGGPVGAGRGAVQTRHRSRSEAASRLPVTLTAKWRVIHGTSNGTPAAVTS